MFPPAANYTHYKDQSQTTIQRRVLFSIYRSPSDSYLKGALCNI